MTGSRDNGKKYPEKREILFQAVMEEADGDGNGKMFSWNFTNKTFSCVNLRNDRLCRVLHVDVCSREIVLMVQYNFSDETIEREHFVGPRTLALSCKYVGYYDTFTRLGGIHHRKNNR